LVSLLGHATQFDLPANQYATGLISDHFCPGAGYKVCDFRLYSVRKESSRLDSKAVDSMAYTFLELEQALLTQSCRIDIAVPIENRESLSVF